MSNKIDNISAIGKRILKAIDDQRLRKKDIYEKMDISRQTLDNWISGATAPDHLQLESLYNILGIESNGSPKQENVKLIPADVWEELQDNNAVF